MEKGVPSWVKALVYVLVPVGALIVVYKLIIDYLSGPLNAVKDLWKQQYDDYVRELKQYAEEDEGNLTTEHQTILDQKRKVIQQTEATFVQVSGGYYGILEYAITLLFATIGIYLSARYGPDIIAKWKGLIKKGDMQTAMGQQYVSACMMADDLAAQGLTSQATNLVTVMQNRFDTIDAPYMQSQISYYQSQLPNLVGWELLYAQFMIQAYQIELSMIPIWFTYLPPIIRSKA